MAAREFGEFFRNEERVHLRDEEEELFPQLGTPRTTPAPAVAKITKLRAQGLTLQAIAGELNRLRVPTTRGGSKWRPSSVRSVLLRASRAP